MTQPVRLSAELIDAARRASVSASRSIAAQIEHWASLGRAVDPGLTSSQTAALKNAVHEPAGNYGNSDANLARALVNALADALSPGSQTTLRNELHATGQPLYGTDPAAPGLLVRRNPDGSRTLGEWRDNAFIPMADEESLEQARPLRKQSARKGRR